MIGNPRENGGVLNCKITKNFEAHGSAVDHKE